MPVLFLIAIVVVLVGIFFAATGRGGELSREPADHAPLDLGPVSAADVALLRPPTAMWGYNMQVTDEALDQIARAMRERDVTISYLQDQLAGYGSYAEPRGVRARLDPEASDDAGTRATPEVAGALGIAGAAAIADAGGTRGAEIADFGETRATPEFFGIAEMFGPAGGYGASDVLESSDTLESHDARQFPEDLEISHSPEEREPLGTLGPVEPLESPEPPATAELPATEPPATEPAAAEPPTAEHPVAEPPTTEPPTTEPPTTEPPTAAATAAQAPGPPQTPLVLKASRPRPEPHEPTQPSQILSDPEEAHDATEPSAVLSHDEEADQEADQATQPAAAPALAPDEAPGPQGAFDTHGWWAQQKEAAREEQVQRQGSGEQNGDSVAAAEEQGR